MSSNEYSFMTYWTVQGASLELIYDILIHGKEFVRWWPEVYLQVDEQETGGDHGIGKAATLHTKGWLPYTLRWSMKIDGVNYPNGFTLRALGDFDGRGTWKFTQRDSNTIDIEFDWRLKAEKPLLKYLSFALKPFFSANHRWAMARGLEGLKREIARRTMV
ncbi:MAG: hypothetical protein U0930_05320 [Pirellulales bacterium]